MKNKKLYLKSEAAGLALTALAAVCFAASDALGASRAAGLAAGAAAAALSLYWLCRAMESAPSLSRVVTYYCLHLAAEFGVVLVALFVPQLDPVGALVPQLFCVPVLAACFFLEK